MTIATVGQRTSKTGTIHEKSRLGLEAMWMGLITSGLAGDLHRDSMGFLAFGPLAALERRCVEYEGWDGRCRE